MSTTPTNVSVASGSLTAVGAGSATAADSGSAPDTFPGLGDTSVHKLPPRKKKRSEMDIDKLLDEQEELFTKYANLNDISMEHIKKLANQLPSMKPQKKSSDYNILVYFKGKEVNAGQGKGSRTALKDLRTKVKEDKDLQEIFQDPEAMKALCQKYNEEKAEEKVAASGLANAHFLYESTDANSFGMVVHVLNLYESYVVMEEKEEITGAANLSMSYVSFAKNIVVPYKVNITGWPDDVPRSYPQQLAADHTKRLYNAWNSSEAHWYCMTPAEAKTYQSNAEKNRELEPRVRKKQADAGSKRRHDDDDDNSEKDDAAHPSKGSRRKRAVCDDSNEESGADDAPAKKKSRGTGKGTAKKKSVGTGKKLAEAGGGSRNSAGGSGGGKKVAGGGGKKSVGMTRKGGTGGSKKVAGGGMKTAGAGKKSVVEKGKVKKKS
ncbi:hypothetical protein BT96DRAFT_945036 [Gymnopus androsaceus JB14]|uniref:Uncharacterized protein n=1 Tax=Gymnopus androsaceus JB14 TaxID=1447944 RepID=A0A6A4H157_9AGAR|nr:hypothetical protein BT96DRAFT_945036 [Gymnopus androsaceus JB14]